MGHYASEMTGVPFECSINCLLTEFENVELQKYLSLDPKLGIEFIEGRKHNIVDVILETITTDRKRVWCRIIYIPTVDNRCTCIISLEELAKCIIDTRLKYFSSKLEERRDFVLK